MAKQIPDTNGLESVIILTQLHELNPHEEDYLGVARKKARGIRKLSKSLKAFVCIYKAGNKSEDLARIFRIIQHKKKVGDWEFKTTAWLLLYNSTFNIAYLEAAKESAKKIKRSKPRSRLIRRCMQLDVKNLMEK